MARYECIELSMKVFKYEKELGLEEQILSQGSTSIVLDAFSSADNVKMNKAVAASILPDRPPTSDLMSVAAILVSTTWNLNDDIFSPKETWGARHTPYMKPANKGHLGRESVNVNSTFGVIASTIPLDKDLDVINQFSDDEIPGYFHLMVNIFLWERYFPKQCKEIKEKLAVGQMFVSMECFFDSFDYGLKSVDNEIIVVPRDDNSSWMSKYLRVNKGPGILKIDDKEYRIGRLLREITFSGVGFVEKPANPESIIFKDYISFASNGENSNISFSELKNNSVLFLRKSENYLWQTN